MQLTKDRLILIFTSSLLIINLLVGFSINFLWIQNILSFPILILLPGVLISLLLKIKLSNIWEKLIYSTAFSLLFLMSLGLLINYLLPHFGISRPLEKWPLLISFDIFTSVLISAFAFFGKFTTKKFHFPKIGYWRTLLALSGPVLILLSVLGSIQLNNGADNYLVIVMLTLSVGLLALLIGFASRISLNLLLWCLYCIALSFLLMTSMRGWFTTGHDIQREYHVFELTRVTGSWEIERFRDAYNACLSITILPTIFSNFLSVTDNYIYKSYFQVIFALVPIIIFLIARRFVSAQIAILTFIYFISFPTFFGDMPFLNRQEMAFLFLGLMLLIIFTEKITPSKKKIIFLLLALGLIFSHYSTTYISVGILAIAWIIRLLLGYFRPKKRFKKIFANSALLHVSPTKKPAAIITIPVVLAVAAASFLWSSVLTDTSQGLTSTLYQTFFHARQGLAEDAKSNDVLYSLFSFKSIDLQQQLNMSYSKEKALALKLSHPADFYDPNTYQGYQTKVVEGDVLPLTSIGQNINKYLDVKNINSILRQSQARILQLFIIIGLSVLLFRRLYVKTIPTEYLVLALGSGLIVFAVVVLPFLSVEYGLLRAFQQSLMLLGVFIVIGSLTIFPGRFNYKLIGASILALGMMLSSIGIIPQFLGGYYPQLHLNNSGLYYDVFYTHRSEVLSMSWLSDSLSKSDSLEVQSEVQTDRFAIGRITAAEQINYLNDIYPSLVRKNSYVYLGYTNTVKHQAAVSNNGNTIIYTLPIQFFDEQKDLIYNDGGSRIYK